MWEIILKAQSGKLARRFDLRAGIEEILNEPSWSILPLRAEVLRALTDLPRYTGIHSTDVHRASQTEDMTIVTPDLQIGKYRVPTIW